MKTNYFETVESVKEIKRLYRLLAFDFHPDRKPAGEKTHYNSIMSEINAQYHNALKSADGEKSYNQETGKEHTYKYNPVVEQHTMDALCKLFAFSDIPDTVEINLVGTWIWIEGVARTDKAFIQHIKQCTVTDETGWNFYFRWNSTRLCWQFNPSKYKAQHSRQGNDIIKSYYGVKQYSKSESTGIA